jgi:hypothetical protein
MITTKHELEILFANAALAMCGKRIAVHLQEPPISNFDGEYYTINGKPNIDISPNFDEQTTLFIFAHECAHAVLQHGVERDASLLPRSQVLTPYGERMREAHPDTIKREKQADTYAQIWLEYARANCKEYSGGSELERKLRCLSGWIPLEQRKRIEMIATSAAIKAVDVELWKRQQLKTTKR